MIADFERLLDADIAATTELSIAFRRWCADLALTQSEILQVNLVVEELVTNVIVHGFRAQAHGWLRLRVRHEADHLTVELCDNAPAFNPFRVPPPQFTPSVEEREIGGLGIHFVRVLTDGWSYRREAGQNIVRVRKKLTQR